MAKLRVRDINNFLKQTKEAAVDIKGNQRDEIDRRIQTLKSLLAKFRSTRRGILSFNNRKTELVNRSTNTIYKLLTEIEISILEIGGNLAEIKNRVPLEFSKHIDYIRDLIKCLESFKVKLFDKHIDTLRKLYSDFEDIESEKHKYEPSVLRNLEEEISREMAAIEQILHPEKTILVNIRERFD